ncbi:MAG: 3-dehydroquinate synthase [Tissierellia bacterium]|nr:3-dehydroquinate synthase [Tissierellia bacterium]
MEVVAVKASTDYKVMIDKGIIHSLEEHLPCKNDYKCLLLMDENVNRLYGEKIMDILRRSGRVVWTYIIPAAESSKSFGILEDLLEFMAEKAFTRSDFLLAFGGGVTGDLGGFAAAIYQRGIDYVQIPTTLLSAVDSSVGGKTAINLRAGKNLVGAFKQPALVLCDPELFETLTEDDFASGVSEIIKYSILFDQDLFERLASPLKKESDDLEEVIKKCVALKAAVVLEDELDHGRRQLLNLGHTIGHGIEKASGFSIKHGHAVAMGMGIMARACAAKGLCNPDTAKDIERILKANSLPVNTEYSPEELLEYAKMDKKTRGEKISIIVMVRVSKVN